LPNVFSTLQAKLRLGRAKLEKYITDWILDFLAQPTGRYAPFYAPSADVVRDALQPGDILLVEGNSRLSATIKYLTQSTWSHAALYVGERPDDLSPQGEPNVLLEAEAETGVVTVPLSKYVSFHTRICRGVGLDDAARDKVIAYALAQVGTQYDSQRIVDLARYLFPYPPVPVWFRRRMLAIGSGDPTRAICSTLIAQAFASIRYPILPERASINGRTYGIAPYVQSEIDHIRTYGLYTPRDFDVSPFFAIVKPTLAAGFDYRTVQWGPPKVSASDLAQAKIVALPQ
jgi:hypothetical protein